jgi:hypothetical protein
LQNSIETRLKITNERFVIFSHVSIIIVTFGYVILLGSCATKKNALIEPMLDTVSTKTLIIQDNQIILGTAGMLYDPESLGFWISFPNKQLAIFANKPTFHNSKYYFVFRYQLSDSSQIRIVAANRFRKTREWRYIDTVINIQDLPVGITHLDIHRIPAHQRPDRFKPVLEITPIEFSLANFESKRVFLDYDVSNNNVISKRLKGRTPKSHRYKRLMEYIATGVNVRDEK